MIIARHAISKNLSFVTKDNFLKLVSFENQQYSATKIYHDIIESVVFAKFMTNKKIMVKTHDSEINILDTDDFTCKKITPDIRQQNDNVKTKKQSFNNGTCLLLIYDKKNLFISYCGNEAEKIYVDLDQDVDIIDVNISGKYIFIHTNSKIIIKNIIARNGLNDYELINLITIDKKYTYSNFYHDYFFLLNNGTIDIYNLKYEKEYSTGNLIKLITVDHVIILIVANVH